MKGLDGEINSEWGFVHPMAVVMRRGKDIGPRKEGHLEKDAHRPRTAGSHWKPGGRKERGSEHIDLELPEGASVADILTSCIS